MKKPLFAALLLMLAAGLAAGAGIPEALDAPNYKRLSPSLAVSGKPSKEALASLQKAGFRTAIDLRQPAEGVSSAREAVEAQGLKFVSVPVSPATFTLEDARRVEAVLADQKAAPVLLFCSSSNRVGGVVAVIERMRGRTKEEALAEGKKAGLKSPAMEQAVLRVLAEAPAKEAAGK
ncbi:MAG: sulfur transferase domain-containing protein [Thermoanaerobaculia bacterium]